MHDRRIARGSTYAAMVIPAGTNPDNMITNKEESKRKSQKRPIVFLTVIILYLFRV